MWQVSLLLANSNKPLPPAAVAILKGETAARASGNGRTGRAAEEVARSGAMGLGATLKKIVKIALMSLGASSPEKKAGPPAGGTKPRS